MFASFRNPGRNLCGVLLLLAWLIASAPPLQADPVQLRPATNLYAAGMPMDLGDYAIPCVADWNGDGRKDLLVGYRSADKIAVFLNVGTAAEPVLTNSFNLQAGGLDIIVPGSSCGAPAPWVCDFNRDGRRDLLVGGGADGRVYFFAGTNTDADPKLAPAQLVQVDGVTLSVGIRATPCIHDWDEDGLPDLICGTGGGSAFWFRNTSPTGIPVYSGTFQIQAGGGPLSLNIRAVVRVFDWDGDGLKDLVGSSSTGVYWCRNTGNNSVPLLDAPVAIRAPLAGGLTAINTSARMRLDLAVWNNDGVVDLLLGNADGTVAFFEGYRFQLTSIAPAAAVGVALQWRSARDLKYHVLSAPGPAAPFSIAASNLPSAGNFTTWTNTASANQEFYRVQIAP
jgi:hypothetical protein